MYIVSEPFAIGCTYTSVVYCKTYSFLIPNSFGVYIIFIDILVKYIGQKSITTTETLCVYFSSVTSFIVAKRERERHRDKERVRKG